MGVTKGTSIIQRTFDDEKQFFLPDGRPLEEVPIREQAIHHDNKILSGLVIHLMVQAVQDWQKLNKGGRKIYASAEGGIVWRNEMLKFFNGSFCCDILDLLVPDMTQEEALTNMDSLDFNRRQIGVGMGKLKDYGYHPGKGGK